MVKLPEQFLIRVKRDLGDKYEDFVKSYDRQPYKAIRVNTLKITTEEFKNITPFALSPVPWERNGFYVNEEKAGKTVLHSAGLYYVQEPSAMSASPKLNVKGGEIVLDMCSAPGGKGTQLAQEMNGKGLIVLNEIDFSRAKILSRNVERLGIKNAVVTCATPEKIAKNFTGFFDKVLVDAPCSGEGMFLKEPQAIDEWSEKNVELCANRQEKILDCAQKVLKKGGSMVYSTCTFAPEEDELQIEKFLERYQEFTLISQEKLLPHEVKGEGHFVALLKKQCDHSSEDRYCGTKKVRLKQDKTATKRISAYREFEEKHLKISFDNLYLVGDTIYSLPNDCPDLNTDLQVLRAGVCLGEFKGDRFEPSHSLAMCLKADEVYSIDIDEKTALNYLKGLTFNCDEKENGWRVVTYLNYPLGWCKCSIGVAKNHLPKGIRI
ncbi:MAG: RsmF rRNA methyltransferase first C-terminal domain-containing protein [Candidatus Coproplasma sp.]